MPKKATSVRLDAENEAKIKALAKRDSLTMGQVINRIIAEYSGKKGDVDESSLILLNKEIGSRFEHLERELGMQRQRTNILKNQLDHLLRTQHGKGRTDKYSDYNKSE